MVSINSSPPAGLQQALDASQQQHQEALARVAVLEGQLQELQAAKAEGESLRSQVSLCTMCGGCLQFQFA
jgi:hypothetical protein